MFRISAPAFLKLACCLITHRQARRREGQDTRDEGAGRLADRPGSRGPRRRAPGRPAPRRRRRTPGRRAR
ncbi:hypothetical protein AQF52_0104 [Streptomyces venezuelae]|nr:hypothetical protein AQF52_0104 [Streptomyces venezuelae]CUM44112.1 hypothetical protein BN2537_17189 [Streptomyces venezuelae]